jgi:hypothetical protein
MFRIGRVLATLLVLSAAVALPACDGDDDTTTTSTATVETTTTAEGGYTGQDSSDPDVIIRALEPGLTPVTDPDRIAIEFHNLGYTYLSAQAVRNFAPIVTSEGYDGVGQWLDQNARGATLDATSAMTHLIAFYGQQSAPGAATLDTLRRVALQIMGSNSLFRSNATVTSVPPTTAQVTNAKSQTCEVLGDFKGTIQGVVAALISVASNNRFKKTVVSDLVVEAAVDSCKQWSGRAAKVLGSIG